jgi:hypothetical protein
MTANYVLLEKITVGAATAASVTFSGIPQTGYTDLVVHMSPRTTSGNIYGDVRIKFNGANTNFSARYIEGNGATAILNLLPLRRSSVRYRTQQSCHTQQVAIPL